MLGKFLKIYHLTYLILDMPKNRPVLISGIDQAGDLILTNGGITNVDNGDTVTWIIGPRSGVKKINNIK